LTTCIHGNLLQEGEIDYGELTALMRKGDGEQ